MKQFLLFAKLTPSSWTTFLVLILPHMEKCKSNRYNNEGQVAEAFNTNICIRRNLTHKSEYNEMSEIYWWTIILAAFRFSVCSFIKQL